MSITGADAYVEAGIARVEFEPTETSVITFYSVPSGENLQDFNNNIGKDTQWSVTAYMNIFENEVEEVGINGTGSFAFYGDNFSEFGDNILEQHKVSTDLYNARGSELTVEDDHYSVEAKSFISTEDNKKVIKDTVTLMLDEAANQSLEFRLDLTNDAQQFVAEAKTTPIWCENWQGNVYAATKNGVAGVRTQTTLVGAWYALLLQRNRSCKS